MKDLKKTKENTTEIKKIKEDLELFLKIELSKSFTYKINGNPSDELFIFGMLCFNLMLKKQKEVFERFQVSVVENFPGVAIEILPINSVMRENSFIFLIVGDPKNINEKDKKELEKRIEDLLKENTVLIPLQREIEKRITLRFNKKFIGVKK